MYNKLFSSGNIGKVKIKNRLVMAPMTSGLANLDGTPTKEMISFYEARAIGEAGLIILESAKINEVHGSLLMRQLSVARDKNIAPLANLAQTVHKHGSKVMVQLNHPGRQTISALIGGQPVVSASAIPCKSLKQETRALTTEEVKELIKQFIDGAKRVQKAGFDGVELHAAHGYLLQQFLSPYTNKREDEYGGSFENRLRVVIEIIQGIKEECGTDFPVGVRLSVEEFLDKTGITEDYIHIEDGIKIAKELEKVGIDFIDVSCGLYETESTWIEPGSSSQGCRRDLIKAVKDNVNIPVIGVSAIKEPQIAEDFLKEGVEDFVSMGRAWLADEEWGRKVQEGRENELRKCIGCLHCFQSIKKHGMQGIPVECAVNPRVAKELEYSDFNYDTDNHNVVVVGGGLAGMCAAETLAKRGVKVVLIDKNNESVKIEWVNNYYSQSFAKLNIKAKFNAEITKEAITMEKPDTVILFNDSRKEESLIKDLENEGIKVIENIIKDNEISTATKLGYKVGYELFTEKEKQTSFKVSDEELKNFGKVALIDKQEGIYTAYLTDPEAIAKILPPPLKPFSMPIAILSVCHINDATYSDDYYEAILSVYATYGNTVGVYPVALLLGGLGAEDAVHYGRNNGGIPKKLDADVVIRKNGNKVTAGLTRRGTQLVNISMELGEYNSPLMGVAYQSPEANKSVFVDTFYFHIDRQHDKNGVAHFTSGGLLMNKCEYKYKSWEPGFVSMELKSSIDDPWAELPIRTIIGGAYSENGVLIDTLNLVEEVDAEKIIPYLLTAKYDRTLFMETGRR